MPDVDFPLFLSACQQLLDRVDAARVLVAHATEHARTRAWLHDERRLYWHQHEKTKGAIRGEWFASGDRYERREDGAYVYVERMDDMLTIGGLWVSPIDMELSHPRVEGVGVIGVTVEDATRVAAYVECAGGEPDDEALADELREWCKERMRRYEYPHFVEFVDTLPRTLTGKVQRFAPRERAEQSAPA